jgi:formate dehydrogenase maturation protein FdhE
MELGITSHTPRSLSRMPTRNSTLGVCPFCGSTLESGSIILEYETGGERRVYAECEECDEPVHPE